MMGFIRGITLEDHPQRPAKAQVTSAVEGSAGIPDSLVHKPVDTSGRAGWPALSSLICSHLLAISHLHPYSLSLLFCFISYPLPMTFLAPRLAIPVRGGRRTTRSLTCENWCNDGKNCDSTDGFIFRRDDHEKES